jgi:hypothetical protein
MMTHSDFKVGVEFRYRDQTWRCTDVGTRTVTAICLTEVWTTRAIANTGKKERLRLTTIEPKRFIGPPYGVPEQVIDERALATCVPLGDWEAARRLLGLEAAR